MEVVSGHGLGENDALESPTARRLTVGSLFSGIGGIDLGFAWAGFETRWMCEIDPYCQKVLAKHWPGVPIYGDIRTVTDAPTVDVIAGGFPCQPFSVAGKRRGAADDRHLWPEMLRVIQTARPRWVVAENVPGIIGMALDGVCADLEAEGYEVWPVVFPACSLGAWHRRDRLWIIAHSPLGQGDERKPGNVGAAPGRRQGSDTTACACSADVADAPCDGPQGAERPSGIDGYARLGTGVFRESPGEVYWHDEPRLARLAHGIPDRVDRLEALGNAVVPACAEVIARSILHVEQAYADTITPAGRQEG